MTFFAVAVASVGSAVIGGVVANKASKRASQDMAAANETAQDANEIARETAKLQHELGKETLEFNKEYYRDVVRPAADFDMQTRQTMMPRLMQAFDNQERFADQQREDYLENWQPLEQRVRDDALNYDSSENIGRRMGIAASAANQQFSNAAGQMARNLGRYGINPNSSAFARTNANLANQQALTSAGMQTQAAFDTMDRGVALRAGAANFGRNMPNAAATFGQLGNQTASTGAGITGGGVTTSSAAGNFMNQGFGLGAGILDRSAATNLGAARNSVSIADNNMRLAAAQAQGVGSLFGGIGQGIGMWGRTGFPLPGGGGGFGIPGGLGAGRAFNFDGVDPQLVGATGFAADGGSVDSIPSTTGMTPDGRDVGLIRGPGTDISDSVPGVNVDTGRPLRLGNKEYVVPGDVVEKLGTLYFDKLIEKHHTPAEIQRLGLARSA